MSSNLIEPTTRPRIVNPDSGHPKARLVEPTTLGYIYLAASVQSGPTPLVLPSAKRSKLLGMLKLLAREIERVDEVVKASVFRAIVIPPTARSNSYLKRRRGSLHYADFDVFVLIQTTSPATTLAVQTRPAYSALVDIVRRRARSMHLMAAHNVRRIADVDTAGNGLFLFNHFAADDPETMVELWEYLAGWYTAETGLDNSVALAPLAGQPSEYAIVNWARWDEWPLRHFWRQLSKPSFWSYVTANLEANRAGSMPIYCRLA